MPKYFKGKSINYHTSVTLSKKERVLVWIVFITGFILFILNMFLFESVWKIVLADFIVFFIIFGISLLIIFSKKHEEERIENEIITKK